MTKLYELTLETQIRRLRRTAIFCALVGGFASFQLFAHSHVVAGILAFVVTIQVVAGSFIIMRDIQKDLIAKRGADGL